LTIICTPSSDNGKNEGFLSIIKLKLTLTKARELEGSIDECFDDRLDFVVNFVVVRKFEKVFDEELETV
jgi:hypothetical protein